ncbi:putative CID domain-containing protein [Helianthus annuus]|nr:putative CID domain-containing protein [Helianthus annuus]
MCFVFVWSDYLTRFPICLTCLAFCNPTDVEAFTEEKKESLMNKRHGKGADFLRAVREIIDSHEELKKQEQSNNVNNINGQIASTNGVKSEECVASSASKDEAVTPTVDSCPKISDSLEPNNDDKITPEWHNGNLAVKKAPLPTTYSRKKYSNNLALSARRSRSSVKEDAVLNNGNSLSLARDGPQKRTKRVRTSPGSSDGPGSNASPEENRSEIATVDSDTKNLNEGNCVQSDYNTVIDNEYDMKLSQTLEFQNKAVITKKKRKPSRKREFIDKVDKTDPTESIQNSVIEKSIGKYSKEDGDEHLPLVKRARVRMGRTTDEAALPPSKRLHRALEAMSAYVTEDKQCSPGGPSTMKTIINGNLESKDADSSSNISSPVEHNETIDELDTCSQPSRTSSPEQKLVEVADDKDYVMLDSFTEAVETVAGSVSPKPSSDDLEKKESSPELKKDPSDVSGSGWSSDPVSGNLENGIVSHDDVTLLRSSPQKSCNIVDHPIQDDVTNNAIVEDAEGTKKSIMEADDSPSLASVKELTVDPDSELFHSTHISEDETSHKSVGCSSPNVHEKTTHTGDKWSTISEANASLTSFEASLGALTRTKKSIDRATRIAIDCAKFGIAVKVVETIARCLEAESSLHKRVDLFFLVDSIAQCSRGLRGDAGGLYPSAIQAVLPRLLLAAAPPGSSALENRRQCLKVLKLWQERKILPEPMIRHHIRELDSLNNLSSRISNSRRPFRNERAFDDPVREVEGMLVDEYGSNSSIQLSGFCMPTMLKDEKEESDSDAEGFEAVTPERDPEICDGDKVPTPSSEKHTHVLEDVDGELEMEDVAPTCEGDVTVTADVAKAAEASQHQLQQQLPPLPIDLPPSSPPLPNSPPPHASFPPPPPPATLPPPPPPHVALPQSPPPPVSITTPPPDTLPTPSSATLPAPLPLSSENGNDDSPQSTAALSVQATSNVHLRPPHPAPSSQFSYFQSDQSCREIPPPSYPGRFHFVNGTDTGNFHSDHDRMHVPPQDDSWRFPPPPFSGKDLDFMQFSY